MSGTDEELNLFLSGFTARHLAEPLLSFDDTTPLPVIRAAMKAQQLEFVGIRRSGVMHGWLTRDEAAGNRTAPTCHTFEPATLVADAASLHQVVEGLNSAPCLFVRSFGQVSGIIRRDDLQKPPMRMWLFGLVTITELRVTRLIGELCPQEAWQRHLSPGRLQKAYDLQHERRRRGQHPGLLDCLQFADKGKIVARDEALRQRTRFGSHREVEDFVKALQDLRNNLAHSQDLSRDWDVIHELATNLHRIVLGPSVASEPASPSPSKGA